MCVIVLLVVVKPFIMSALEWLYAENSLIYHNQQVSITAGDETSETNKPKYFYLKFAILYSYPTFIPP
jgi:hypothetical protein